MSDPIRHIASAREHQIAFAVDIPKRIVAVVLDDNRAEVFRLPTGFKLDVAGSSVGERDKHWIHCSYVQIEPR